MKRNKVQAIQKAPVVVYDNGKTMARKAGKGRFVSHVGFRTEAGVFEHLDAALKDLGKDLGIELIEVQHQRPGSPEVKAHWALTPFGAQEFDLHFYPLTQGPVAPTITASMHPSAYQSTLEAGLGLRWDDGDKSRLSVRGYLGLLGSVGIVDPVQITTKSRMTDKLLVALIDHVRVCEAADALRPDGLSEPVLLCDLALRLGPGEEEPFGKGDTTMVTPFRSLHPPTIDSAYIKGIWRPESVAEAAVVHWPGVQAWALGFAGSDEPPPPPAPERAPAPAPEAEDEDDAAEGAGEPAAHPSGMTVADAEARFFARYGETVGGTTWQVVQRYMGRLLPRPATVEGWITVAQEVRDLAGARDLKAPADPRATAIDLLRRMIAAAERMGVTVQIPDRWESLPLAQLTSHGRTLRATMIATVQGAWKAERDGGGHNPAAEVSADLQQATPESMADLHARIVARLTATRAVA